MLRSDGIACAFPAASSAPRTVYLSGVVHPAIFGQRTDLLREPRPDLGVILTPAMGNRPELTTTPWAADNACFTDPAGFRLERYLRWLASMSVFLPTCLFAVAPDVVADAVATWERSAPVLPLIRAAGYPAALVAQNGIEDMEVEWDAFDVLFLGGCTRWKLSDASRIITAEARRRGKPVHMGRVNSRKRLRTGSMWGCTSVDGTFLAPAPDFNVPRLVSWLDELNREPSLQLGGAHPQGFAA
ncbi:hypothetical protein [Azospirillum himalayense]|uniref:Uncharacterized protein n=1 Tax=Azospirillum himalayense TaxID=654847 RepID=A0ABW0GBZ8_9PROT